MKIIYHTLTLVLGLGLIGCSDNNATQKAVNQEPVVESINVTQTPEDSTQSAETGIVGVPTYIVGTKSSYPPFAVKDAYGMSSGYDVDLIKAIAKEQNFNVTFKPLPWSKFPDTLNDDSVDIWMSGIAVVPEHKDVIEYTDPYLTHETVAFVKKGDGLVKAINLETLSHYRISAQKDSVDYNYLDKLITEDSIGKLIGVDNTYLGIVSVLTDETDVLVANDKVIKYHLSQHPNVTYEIIPLDILKTEIALTTKKGRTELVNKLNEGLKKVKNDTALYQEINKKWFGMAQVSTKLEIPSEPLPK